MGKTYIKVGSNSGVKAITLYQLMVESENSNSRMRSLVPFDTSVAGFTSLAEAERAKTYMNKKYNVDLQIIPNTHHIFSNVESFRAWRESNQHDYTLSIPVEKNLAGINKIYIVTEQTVRRVEFNGEYINESEAKRAAGKNGEIKKRMVFDNANKFYRYFAYKPEDVTKQTEIKL